MKKCISKIFIIMAICVLTQTIMCAESYCDKLTDIDYFFICVEKPIDYASDNSNIKMDIWVCIINKSISTLHFPTGLNDHAVQSSSKLWLSMTNKINPCNLQSVIPRNKLNIVELRRGEIVIFKYENTITLDADKIKQIAVQLEIPSDIGKRYDCWHGKLTGTLAGDSRELKIKIENILRELKMGYEPAG